MAVETVSFAGPEGRQQRAWMTEPRGDGPARGVIVIHEIYGLVENQQPVLDRFAAEGYVALAPDLFDRPGAGPLCVVRTMRDMQKGQGVAMEVLRTAQQFLRSHPRVTGERIGVVGFCLGGGFALLMALEPGVGAVAPFYGMSPAYLDRVADSCPVVASFGERDMVFRKPAKGLGRALERAGIENDVKMYPDAGHSFMTADRPGLMHKIGSVGPLKVGYNPEAAEDAWKRMLGFFDQYVRA